MNPTTKKQEISANCPMQRAHPAAKQPITMIFQVAHPVNQQAAHPAKHLQEHWLPLLNQEDLLEVTT